MSAWIPVDRKRSRSRGATCPVPFGRVFAAGAAAGAPSPFRGGCGLPAGALPPWGFCAGAAVPGLAMALTLVHRLATPLADAHLAAVGELLDAGPRGLVAAGADEQYVGQRQRALALDDAALPQLLRGPLVLLDHVDLLDHHAGLVAQHPEHLAPLAALAARDDRHRIASPDVRTRHQMTSGASEMIFVNWRSRSSRATGPKMRVPTGFSSGLIRTTALRSKRMYDPSRRRTSLTVRTTTARATSPFFTVPSGTASLMATMTVSPSDA